MIETMTEQLSVFNSVMMIIVVIFVVLSLLQAIARVQFLSCVHELQCEVLRVVVQVCDGPQSCVSCRCALGRSRVCHVCRAGV